MIDYDLIITSVMVAWLIYHDVRHSYKFGSIRLRPERKGLLIALLINSFKNKFQKKKGSEDPPGGDPKTERR